MVVIQGIGISIYRDTCVTDFSVGVGAAGKVLTEGIQKVAAVAVMGEVEQSVLTRRLPSSTPRMQRERVGEVNRQRRGAIVAMCLYHQISLPLEL